MKALIAQGAEAKLWKMNEDGKTFMVKERVQKRYRLPVLDEKLRKLRTRRELSMLERAAKIIPVPHVMKTGREEKEFLIKMDFIAGEKVADVLDDLTPAKRSEVCNRIGEHMGVLHNAHLIHGDLTTSNMILHGHEVYLIDFGLSFMDQKAEHKAVDVHLLKQALESKHHAHFTESFAAVVEGYTRIADDAALVLERLEKVEGRGHYKNKQAKF